MAKPGKETPGLSEASGSRPVTGFRASMISVEPTVVHSGQQDGDLGSERTTDEQTVEASGGSAPAGDPAEGEGVDAARFAELRLPTPLLAQLDAIAKQECNIQQSLSQEAELRAQISEINKEQQALKREQYKVSGKARDRITERLAVLAEKAKKLGVSADVSQSEATFAHGTSDFDARLAKREGGELDGTEELPQSGDPSPAPKLRGHAVVFLEADGAVTSAATGILDDPLRLLRDLLAAVNGELVLTSEWRHDPRLVRFLEGTMARLDMKGISLTTPSVGPRNAQQPATLRKVQEIRAFLGASRCNVPYVIIDAADLSRAGVDQAREGAEEKAGGAEEGAVEGFAGEHLVRVSATGGGLSRGGTRAALDAFRLQAVLQARANNRQMATTEPAEMDLAFAMGTHYRLGQASPVDWLRRPVQELLRDARNRKGGADAMHLLLRRTVCVPGDFPTIDAAVEEEGSKSLTLRILLAEGIYNLDKPILVRGSQRVILEKAPDAKEVELVRYGGGALVSVVDEAFVRSPLGAHPGISQAHVVLRGLVLHHALIDGAAFKEEWIAETSAANAHRETRGLYRQMLASAGITVVEGGGAAAGASIDEAKAALAAYHLSRKVEEALKKQAKDQRDAPEDAWPSVVEVCEGSLVLHDCTLRSECGVGALAARTGVARLVNTTLDKCRAGGVVASKGGRVELQGAEVRGSRGVGLVTLPGASFSADACTIDGNVVGAASRGGMLSLSGCVVSASIQQGVVAAGQGSVATLQSVEVSGSGGTGVGAADGGALQLTDVTILKNKGGGLSVAGAGSRCLASSCQIRSNALNGVISIGGAEVMVKGGMLGGNQQAGGAALDAGRLALTEGVAVERNGDHGALAQRGGDVSVRGCNVRENKGGGVVAAGSGSRALVEGGLLGGNRMGAVAADEGVVAIGANVEMVKNVDGEVQEVRNGKVLRQGKSAQVFSRPELKP